MIKSYQILLTLMLVLTSCAVGPNYQRPKTLLDGKDKSFTNLSPEMAAESAEAFTWWTLFKDETLAGLLREVRTSNLDVKQAMARVDEFRALFRMTRSALGPSLNLEGGAERRRLSGNTPIGTAIERNGGELVNNDFQVGPSFSWELDVFGGLRREKAAARADFQARTADMYGLYIQMMAGVSQTYVRLREVQMRLSVAEKNLVSQKEAFAIASARFNAGIVSELDPLRAQVLLASTESQIPLLKVIESESIHRLSVLLGKPPTELSARLNVRQPLPEIVERFSIGIPSDLLKRRPDLALAEAQLRAEVERVGAAKSDYFPKFSLSGNYGLQSRTSGKLFDSGSAAWSMGPTLRWPIFQMGMIRARVAAQGKRAEAAAIAYEHAILKALEEVENAMVSYTNQQRYVALMELAVTNAARAVEVSQDRYKAGLSNFLEVVDAERELYSLEDQRITGVSQVRVALIHLYEALGGGWPI